MKVFISVDIEGCAGSRTVRFETSHYFDVLRMLNYVT